MSELENIQNAYPEISDIIELMAHYDEHHPIHRLCLFLVKLVRDTMTDTTQVTRDEVN